MTDDDDLSPAAPIAQAYGCSISEGLDLPTLHPPRSEWTAVGSKLLAADFTMCIDLTAVDYSCYESSRRLPADIEPERFEVVAMFLCLDRCERIRAKVQVPEDDPTVDSLHELYPGSDYFEREVFDLFGLRFEGHPDLSRILMPEAWEGHPLRKDYETGSIPVQFKGAPGLR